MHLNHETAIIGQKVVLVPYRAEHVPKYHEWMSDPELLHLTASEPLSIEQELEMQRKWRDDNDKLTFIILARTHETDIYEAIRNLPMVGDVNLFIKDSENDRGDVVQEAEVEIMIAEKRYRRKGLARETLGLFLNYATRERPGLAINPYQLFVRIGSSNLPSRALFEQLGFSVSKEVTVFNEIEMRWRWTNSGEQPAVSEQEINALWGPCGKLDHYPEAQT